MIITCEQCHARFRLADEKLKAGGTKVRCSKCKHIFVVLSPETVRPEGSLETREVPKESGTADETRPAPSESPAAVDGDLPAAPPAGQTGTAEQREPAETGGFPDEREFETTSAESAEPGTPPAAAGPSDEFNFGEAIAGEAAEAQFDAGAAFTFESEPAAGSEDFRFEGDAATEFDFAAEFSDNPFASEEKTAEGENSSGLSSDSQTATPEWGSFDFDEPSFATKTEEQPFERAYDAGLKFDEIDFSDKENVDFPGLGPEPDFSQDSPFRPAELEPTPPPPPLRPAATRTGSEEFLPSPPKSGKGAMSRMLLMLVLLLLVLCVAGGYFYFMGNGQQVVDSLLLKIKGEPAAVPVEQRIGLNIEGSSYVDNPDAGQLLVIQGSTTNNFSGARSSIAVKGQILDAGGKVLQQQTVFCGNYLSEEKLRTLKYAQIEEAMNNEFGDSLANMNIKPGATIRFTIVFRNVPKEMANINVEIVDSKAGGI